MQYLRRIIGRRGLSLALALFAALLIGAASLVPWLGNPLARTKDKQAMNEPPAAVSVGTMPAERVPIEQTRDFVGRVEATDRVEVRARVAGYLENVLFQEGGMVKEGSPIYTIERGLFEAAVGQAEGALERARANKILTAAQLQRAEELLVKGAGTVVNRDQTLAADRQAAGTITIDEANLRTAQINLGYTDITAPITGRIGKTNVTKGNVVGPDSGVLTTIVSQDPIYVTFPVSQREFLRLQTTGQHVDKNAAKVRLRFADGTKYAEVGKLNFVDVSVDRSTDTLLVRASFPNPKGQLTDGQLVRVDLYSGTQEDKVVVPQAALLADQEGVYVFVVEDGKAQVRRVKLGPEAGSNVVAEAGLEGGEQVVVEGLQSIRPGTPVTAAPIQTPGRS